MSKRVRGLAKLLQLILKGRLIAAPNFMAIHQTVVKIFSLQTSNRTREKLFPKSEGLSRWGS